MHLLMEIFLITTNTTHVVMLAIVVAVIKVDCVISTGREMSGVFSKNYKFNITELILETIFQDTRLQ